MAQDRSGRDLVGKDEGSLAETESKCPEQSLEVVEKTQKNNLENKKDKRIKTGKWINYRKRMRLKAFTCENCGDLFTSSRKSKKFCSSKCKNMKYKESSFNKLKKEALEILRKEEK